MEQGRGGTGTSKHRTSGHTVSAAHFTGKQGTNAKRKRGLTHKQRHLKRGTHRSKYAKDDNDAA